MKKLKKWKEIKKRIIDAVLILVTDFHMRCYFHKVHQNLEKTI